MGPVGGPGLVIVRVLLRRGTAPSQGFANQFVCEHEARFADHLTGCDRCAQTVAETSEVMAAMERSWTIETGTLGYAGEYARQSAYEDSAIGDSHYLLAELGYGSPAIGLKLGYEVLSGDGTDSFQTPLATQHSFQGWADQFLTTPRNGIDDTYLQISGTLLKKLGWLVRGHWFQADEGGADYGDEVDAQLTWSFFDGLTVGAKYAGYNARSVSVDTSKTWAWAEYRF